MEKKETKAQRHSIAGAFLIELMIAVAILVIVLVGYLQLSIYCFGLTETTRNLTVAITEVQGKLEEMRNHNFDSIVGDYSQGGDPGNTFSLTQLDGMGVIYIDNTNPELLEIEIFASWQEKGNRVIGEDANLNGILDSGEDNNGNGKLDSPVSLVTLIAKK